MTPGATPVWWVWLVLAGLLVLMIYWDLASRTKTLRWMRFLAMLTGLLSLIGLYVKPSVEVDAPMTRIAILTSAMDDLLLDSLRQSDYKVVESLEEYQTLSTSFNIEDLLLVGHGLERWELDQLERPFDFIISDSIYEGPIELEIFLTCYA